MLRTTKWKFEKATVKVVFRLQFHATHIPQSGWEKLSISFIPYESGKIIAKTSKANVRNGTCKWADPIYETTRLLVDSRNKQYDDKLYKLVVGMGTSRSSILGEATINLADYADASHPCVIALPLHGSDYATVLHVTVQLLTAKTGFREFEQQQDRGSHGSSKRNRENEPSTATSSSSSKLQISDDHVNTKTQLGAESKELISVAEETGIHEESSDSPVGCDGSSNASESYYADKHDMSSAHELDSLRSIASGDLYGQSHSQSPPTEKADRSDHQGWSSDYSMDNDLAISHEEKYRLRESVELAESSISELRMELSALQSNANEMGEETRKIGQELDVEISSGKELAREVMVLRSECLKFKDDLCQLKDIKSSSGFVERKMDQAEGFLSKWVNGLLLIEDRISELQKKIFIGVHQSDLSFIHSDLEVLLGIVQDLEKGTVEELPPQHEVQEPGSTKTYDLIEGKSSELLNQLDEAKAERENLVRKMDEMECYHENLVQELEENQKRILGEFQSLTNEHSTCAYAISTCKAETELIQHDMNDQTLKFAQERHALGSANEELEKRVTTAESALRRARLNYSIAVNQLQKDLDMLSLQVLSMFETNQSLIKGAFSESSELFSQSHHNVVRNLQKSDDTCVPLHEKELSGGYAVSDDELCEMFCANLYLDVYSQSLEKTLFEASTDARKMEEKISEVAQQLQLSNKSKDFLSERLQTAVEDVHALSEQIAKLNDVQLQNQILEENLGGVSRENFLLMEKMTECEQLLVDYGVYKSKYEVALAEKLELETLLEVKVLDNGNLQNDLSSVKEELETLKVEFRELERLNENMQKPLDFLQEKIKDLEKERDIARSKIDDMKMNFKLNIHDMIAKLDMLDAIAEKLQLQLESVAYKFKNSMELVENHEQHTDGLLTYLASLELELQKVSSKDTNFFQEILGLDAIADKYERRELTLYESNQEKQDFLMSVENKTEEIDIYEELEWEIIWIVLKAKFDGCCDEMIMLRDKCSELTIKLSEQILQTEEFKSLAEELKDVADVAREKREPEGPSESLRIAFMKERYETTVQELKQKLSVSQRHGEDMLCKLQDALDETESRKKSEASHLKKIEELSFTIVGLEAKLQSIQAELECALLNLECCKEEKEKIVASMQECEQEKLKMEANQELGSICPDFNDVPGGGNALERVHALETELAEALMAKEKSTIRFQSSFLEQHGDKEAFIKSFGDINELIKGTLEIKGKYVNAETELKEMHERYSRLSLQFAEVEGEKQKLMMTLKNMSSTNPLHRNYSSETLDEKG